MIKSKEDLITYIVDNRERLGAEGQYMAKVLFQSIGEERSLSFEQIGEVLDGFDCKNIHPNRKEWFLTAVTGIGMMLYPDQIKDLINASRLP